MLEALDRVGGRTLNHSIGGGHVVEVGGQWLGPATDVAADPTTRRPVDVRGQSPVEALRREAGVDAVPDLEHGLYVDYRSDLPVQRNTYSGRIPTSDPVGTAEAAEALVALDAMAKTVPLDKPWTARPTPRSGTR